MCIRLAVNLVLREFKYKYGNLVQLDLILILVAKRYKAIREKHWVDSEGMSDTRFQKQFDVRMTIEISLYQCHWAFWHIRVMWISDASVSLDKLSDIKCPLVCCNSVSKLYWLWFTTWAGALSAASDISASASDIRILRGVLTWRRCRYVTFLYTRPPAPESWKCLPLACVRGVYILRGWGCISNRGNS